MILAHTVSELRDLLTPYRTQKIGLVPTMGALHEGHLSLVRNSLTACDVTIVSIFVNPTQFGPAEDFSKYPRTLEADVALLVGEERASGGKIVVFAPSAEEMYPSDFSTYVEPGGVALPLEGERRPGHFRGVATVVLKLFNMAQADFAFFGQKDYQQVAVIRQMVRELNVPIEIVMCPIIREPDGLAMSSRNRYLALEARRRATVLYGSLTAAESLLLVGERRAAVIRDEMLAILTSDAKNAVDYVALADPRTLAPLAEIADSVVILLAVRIDGTRLIDNIVWSKK